MVRWRGGEVVGWWGGEVLKVLKVGTGGKGGKGGQLACTGVGCAASAAAADPSRARRVSRTRALGWPRKAGSIRLDMPDWSSESVTSSTLVRGRGRLRGRVRCSARCSGSGLG